MFFDVETAPAVYASLQRALIPQLAALDSDETHNAVPACPGWTIKDVMAHVSGLVAETLAGVPLPRGSDAATARQVADRTDLSLSDVLEEWWANAPGFADFGEHDPAYVAALTSDLVVHAIDIGETLDEPIDIDDEAIRLVAARYGHTLLDRAAQAGIALALVLDGAALVDDVHDGRLTLRASSFDFLRAVTGRRTGAEVRAMNWTGDPEVLLGAAWSQYGPIVD